MDRMTVVNSFFFGLAVVMFTYWCLILPVHLLAIFHGRRKLYKKQTSCHDTLPGVTILKPLTGVDPNLYSNLESFFNLIYPTYELMFCIEEDIDHSAIMVVNSLREKYPNIASRLFIGAQNVGVNPKINNMMQGYEAAKYDLILISDSGLRMKEDTLTDMVLALKENVGLVHQMPFICDREGFAGILEKVYFGTYHAKIYLAADLFGINCVTGMSCLFRKSVLDEAGGLRGLSSYLAEDYYLAQTFHDRGWKLNVASQPAWQNAGNSSVSNFQARMKRWTKLRSALIPSTVFLEPLSECMLVGLLTSLAVTVLFQWSGLAFFFVHTLLWFILDYTLLKLIQNGSLPFSKFEFICGWLFRECTTLYILVQAHLEPVITWRSRKYYVKAGAVGKEVRTQSYV